jgi:Domain of unknown function (DUF3854)
MTRKVLASHHETMLREESGITQKVIDTRGYHTVKTKAELETLGFSNSQRNVPGILIPIYSPTGEIATYQYRPDLPRIDKNGKSVKYETPSGARMVLDVHPFAREMLGDPAVPLLVTEGIKKSDALVSHGLCAVTLFGVWSWRGTNEHGGKTALYEWDYVALNNGRRVYIVFDSDVMLKPGVHNALRRVKALLESR